MPLVLVAGSTGDLTGNVGAKALRDGQSFDLRAFTNLDGTGTVTGALTAAFAWALNPFAPEKPHATVVATPPQVTVAIDAP